MLQQDLSIQLPSPEQSFNPTWANPNGCQLYIKRDDLLHPVISGNKWRKLKYNLQQAQAKQATHILSFGGNYSNHLHALGWCCSRLNIRFTAIVRGYPEQALTPMLNDLKNWGAELHFVDRNTYRQRTEINYLQQLQATYPDACIIPEGGSNQLALKGVAEIYQELEQNYDYILCPVGSGGTMAGLLTASDKTQFRGIGVLKGEAYLEQMITALNPAAIEQNNWQLLHQFHHGGYAKSTPELLDFCQKVSTNHPFSIEPVYSGKLFYATKQLLAQGYFPAHSRVLLLHTGGLQGAR